MLQSLFGNFKEVLKQNFGCHPKHKPSSSVSHLWRLYSAYATTHLSVPIGLIVNRSHWLSGHIQTLGVLSRGQLSLLAVGNELHVVVEFFDVFFC